MMVLVLVLLVLVVVVMMIIKKPSNYVFLNTRFCTIRTQCAHHAIRRIGNKVSMRAINISFFLLFSQSAQSFLANSHHHHQQHNYH